MKGWVDGEMNDGWMHGWMEGRREVRQCGVN